MKRRATLAWQVFVSILIVALISVLTTGLFARYALSEQFSAYVGDIGVGMGGGRGMGRAMLGTAEQSFLAGVDQGIVLSAFAAIAIAAIGAVLLARYLARPLHTLTDGAREFARGDLDHRVDLDGPGEVVDLAVAFNEMADSLGEAETLRRRLVADVAHELRTPLASLRAQTEGIADGVLEMDEARAQSLVEDVSHLSALVNDLQELSIAEAGRLRYDMGDVGLMELAQREAQRVRPLLPEGVRIEVTGSDKQVCGDEMRLGQVIGNLISNAVRHTDAGVISVVVYEADTIAGPGARVEVRDTGEGIRAEDLPFVFERFYRADTSRAAVTGGSGIGLAISRRIVEDHHGVVFATSEPNVLTTVGFEMPVSQPSERAS